MSVNSIQIDIPQMIDLALGTPEVGAVNFNVLRSLLYIFSKKLNLENSRVELQGIQSKKLECLLRHKSTAPTISMVEFKTTEDSEKVKKFINRTSITPKESSQIEKLIVVSKDGGSTSAFASSDEFIRQNIYDPIRIVSGDDFRKLSNRTEDIRDPVGRIIPENREFIDSARGSEDSGNPVSDMWHLLNLTKRLDATEITVEKVTSMIRDLTEEYRNCKKVLQKFSEIKNLSQFIEKVDSLDNLDKSGNSSTKFTQQIQNLKTDIEKLKKAIRQIAYSATLNSEDIGHDIDNILQSDSTLGQSDSFQHSYHSDGSDRQRQGVKLHKVEERFKDIQKELEELNSRLKRVTDITGLLSEDFNIVTMSSQINQNRNDIESAIEKCNHLISEQDEILTNINELSSKFAKYEENVIDRNNIEELLSEKVDYDMLHKKVSISEYRITKRDLSEGLLGTIERLNELVKAWDENNEAFKTNLATKVNEEEFLELKECMEKKFQAQLERIKALAALRREPEAAGTKNKKYLRDVACISCDQDVIMRTQESVPIPKLDHISGQKNLKPYLTYQLDILRKETKNLVNSKNLHHMENMLKQDARDDNGKKIVNRFCGGSHTVITPRKRVEKIILNKPYVDIPVYQQIAVGNIEKQLKERETHAEEMNITTPQIDSSSEESFDFVKLNDDVQPIFVEETNLTSSSTNPDISSGDSKEFRNYIMTSNNESNENDLLIYSGNTNLESLSTNPEMSSQASD